MKAKENDKIKMAITLWYLWSKQNAVREEGRRRSSELLARSIRSYADEVIKSFIPEKQTRLKVKRQWTRPPGVLKLNRDASFKEETASGSWGFLIRDHDGDVVLAGRGEIDYMLSVFQAEKVGCLHGVQAALNLGAWED